MSTKQPGQKGRLLAEIVELCRRRDQLIKTSKERRRRYEERLRLYQPKIDELQRQADLLAARFRKLYRESQNAYTTGQGVLAKQLSIEGKRVQDQCEKLNAQANAMRQELKELLHALEAGRRGVDVVAASIQEQRKVLSELRATAVLDFHRTEVANDLAIEQFLDEFPQHIFRGIKAIICSQNPLFWQSPIRGIKIQARGKTAWDNRNRATIEVAPPSGTTLKEKLHNLKKAIAHELGHVIWEDFLKDEEKAEWFSFHTDSSTFPTWEALQDEVEDFAETLAIFILKPRHLDKKYARRYHLIKEVITRLKSEAI